MSDAASLQAKALELVAAGFSVIPIAANKQPSVKWKVYQERRPTPAEIKRWFPADTTNTGLAILGGAVSGNLEILDFDDLEAFKEFKKLVNTSPEAEAIAGAAHVVRTPSGGFHVYYRLAEKVGGNVVLARDRSGGVRVETRGEGGYVVAPPSPGYTVKLGSLDRIPVLTADQHDTLYRLVRAYNDKPEEAYHGYQEPAEDGQLRPGDDFSNRADSADTIRTLLVEAGWRHIGDRGDNELWQRPGKDGDGPSATLNDQEKVFYVFSSNAEPFAPMKGYSFFSTFAILAHNTDFRAAALDLAAQGYGDEPEDTSVELSADGFGTILPINRHILPRFPTHVMPPWMREFVEATAYSCQTPTDLASLLSIATVAACLAKTVEVAPRPDWTEQVNLYTVCAMGAGTRKSSVFKLCADPLLNYERRINRDNKLKIAEAQDAKAALEAKLNRLRADAGKKENEENLPEILEAMKQLRVELEELDNTAAKPVQLVADDTTPEMLAYLLGQHGGKMAILSADTDVFSMMAGKYSGGTPNLDVYLKGHAGDNLKVQRLGREPDFVDKPALTMGLALQPDVLHGLMRKPGFRGRGIIGRWLYSLPEDNTGYRIFDAPPVTEELLDRYSRIIQSLAEMEPERDEFGLVRPHRMRFAPAANLIYWEFATQIEYRQRPGGDLEDMRDWASKLHGLVARLAALLHVCWRIEESEPWTVPISEQTMKHALDIACYAIFHAKAAFDEMGADDTMNKARRLVDWLKRQKMEEFTKRQLLMSLTHIFTRAEELDAPIKLLLERGYVREIVPEKKVGVAGRKAGSRYEVNPRFWNDEGDSSVVQVPFEEVCK